MTLQIGKVVLHKIVLEDIEILRQWRNDDKIRLHMFYQEIISPEMQLRWFKSLTSRDFYFIISYEGKQIGLINLCEQDEGEGEVGLYIYNENYWGGPAPVYASIALLKFAFEERKLTRVEAKVRAENLIAQSYNEHLGFSAYQNGYQILLAENFYKKLKPLLNRFQ